MWLIFFLAMFRTYLGHSILAVYILAFRIPKKPTSYFSLLNSVTTNKFGNKDIKTKRFLSKLVYRCLALALFNRVYLNDLFISVFFANLTEGL